MTDQTDKAASPGQPGGGLIPTVAFSSPEFSSERKMISPDFGRRPEVDPFGEVQGTDGDYEKARDVSVYGFYRLTG